MEMIKMPKELVEFFMKGYIKKTALAIIICLCDIPSGKFTTEGTFNTKDLNDKLYMLQSNIMQSLRIMEKQNIIALTKIDRGKYHFKINDKLDKWIK